MHRLERLQKKIEDTTRIIPSRHKIKTQDKINHDGKQIMRAKQAKDCNEHSQVREALSLSRTGDAEEVDRAE